MKRLKVVETSDTVEVDASQMVQSREMLEALLKRLEVREDGDFAEKAIYLPKYMYFKYMHLEGSGISLTYELGTDNAGLPVLVPIITKKED